MREVCLVKVTLATAGQRWFFTARIAEVRSSVDGRPCSSADVNLRPSPGAADVGREPHQDL